MADTDYDGTEPDLEPATDSSGERRTGAEEIDLQALADKVYRLMMAEIRLDRARGLAASGQ